jgi:multiple sugar transport system permease protein
MTSFVKGKPGQIVIYWRNYVDMWHNINFGLFLKNSFFICGMTMLIVMALATMSAYALSRFNFPGNREFGIAILATQMIPGIMYLIPLFISFTKVSQWSGLQLVGTYWGMIFIYSAFFAPFSIWILRGFFAAIPIELEEAARIDGCNPLQVFWLVVLPLAIPGVIATGIYVFLTAWDELMFAWVLTNESTQTIPVGIRLFVGNYQNRFDLMMAAATVATLPVLLLFFLLQKQIVKGLTAGAVKG